MCSFSKKKVNYLMNLMVSVYKDYYRKFYSEYEVHHFIPKYDDVIEHLFEI